MALTHCTSCANPARELALMGAAKRHLTRRAIVNAVAQRMREEIGMPPSPALNLNRTAN